MFNFEGHLIHIGLGNSLSPLTLCSKVCIDELEEHYRFLTIFLFNH